MPGPHQDPDDGGYGHEPEDPVQPATGCPTVAGSGHRGARHRLTANGPRRDSAEVGHRDHFIAPRRKVGLPRHGEGAGSQHSSTFALQRRWRSDGGGQRPKTAPLGLDRSGEIDVEGRGGCFLLQIEERLVIARRHGAILGLLPLSEGHAHEALLGRRGNRWGTRALRARGG